MQILVLISLYFLKCTKFDQLILRKIITIVATRCQILTLKCTKIDFGWGSVPDPAGGAYSPPPDPVLDLRGPTSKGRAREGTGGHGRGRQGRGGEGRCARPVCLLVLRGGKGREGEEERKGGMERGEEGKGKGRRKGKGGEMDLAPRKKSWRRHWSHAGRKRLNISSKFFTVGSSHHSSIFTPIGMAIYRVGKNGLFLR